MIRFVGVRKSFKRSVALDGASFTIPRGVLAGILGPNGSGKSTSFKLALGLLKPDEGSVEVNGVNPWIEELEVRRRTGYLPEKPVYPLNVEAWRFLRYIAKLRGARMEDVKRIARMVGIEKLLDRPVKAFSRGYLQRLGLAQALIGDPELLLLDEPTANLDPKARLEILELIKTLQEDLNVTIVIASHILPELQQTVNYIVFLKNGRVIDHGYLAELSHKYVVETTYVARTHEPRVLAREAIGVEGVKSVSLRDGEVLITVEPESEAELLQLLGDMKAQGLVESYELKTCSLVDLYEELASRS